MVDELPFINFSNQKHVDRSTLSRIRSHAQQKVQDEKWKKNTKNGSTESKGARRRRHPKRQSLESTSENSSSKDESAPDEPKTITKRPRKKKKNLEQIKNQIMSTLVFQSLDVSPVDRCDPFDAFPTRLDPDFLALFENYWAAWKWDHSKLIIMQETVTNPVLMHSYLAGAYLACRQDEVRSMVHESKTMALVASGINQLDQLKDGDRRDATSALIWAVIRLAVIKVNQGQLETSLNHINALAHISPTLKDWEGHSFVGHLQSTIGSLLLANFSQSGKILPQLRSPFGPTQTSAVADVRSYGYSVPEDAAMLDPSVKRLVDPAVLDGILALTALFNICEKVEDDEERLESLPHTHTGRQAFEGIKVALRLAQLVPQTPTFGDGQKEEQAWLSQFQDCLRLTGVLFTWNFGRILDGRWDAISSCKNQLLTLVNEQLLRSVLNESLGTGTDCGLRQLVLWVLIVIGSSCRSCEKALYYAELVQKLFPDSEKMEDYRDLRMIGKRLPWIELEDNLPVREFWRLVSCRSSLSFTKFFDTPRHQTGPLIGNFWGRYSDTA